jgi:hypothetical protein
MSIRDPVQSVAEPVLPQSGAGIYVFAGMMNDVKVPQETVFVTETVDAVIGQIVEQEEQYPTPPDIGRHFVRRDLVQPKKKREREYPEDHGYARADRAGHKIVPGIAQSVRAGFGAPVIIDLDPHQKGKQEHENESGSYHPKIITLESRFLYKNRIKLQHFTVLR